MFLGFSIYVGVVVNPVVYVCFAFDSFNQVTLTTDPMGRVTSNGYDGAGNLKGAVIQGVGPLADRVTEYDYNGRGDLIAQTNALQKVSQCDYDGTGNLISQKDPDDSITTYQYDAAGNRTAETRTRTLPGGGVETLVSTFEYDDAGRLTRQRNPAGEVVLTEYNELGKQSEVRTASGATQYEYDIRSRSNSFNTPMTDAACRCINDFMTLLLE